MENFTLRCLIAVSLVINRKSKILESKHSSTSWKSHKMLNCIDYAEAFGINVVFNNSDTKNNGLLT